MLDMECRLMADESHLCSVNYLNKCLDLFAKRSEQEAIACVKRGARPEKLMNTQEADDEPEPPVKGNKKGGKGGKKQKSQQQEKKAASSGAGKLATIQAKLCPFSQQDITDAI